MDIISFFSYSFDNLVALASDAAFFAVPLVLGFFAWRIWLSYVEAEYISKIKWIMLEIRIPKEVYKPPQAMEMILSALDQKGKGSKIEQYWTGRLKPWFSLEIASHEGSLHFYIRTWSKFKDLIESRIYSQYPEAEIQEVSDYTELVPYSKEKYSMFGTEFVLSKEDALPIKTYVDYGMDKGFLDENQRLDPMTPLLEFLGSVGKGEHLWMQILVQSTTDRYPAQKLNKKTGKMENVMGNWRDQAKDYVKKMTTGDKPTKEGETPRPPQLTKTQNENIAAIERNMAKDGLDCGIRVIYLAESGKFNPGQISSMMSSLKHFNSAELNGFKPKNDTGLDYPWEDLDNAMGNPRVGRKKRTLYDAYRRRSFFYPPYERRPFVLTIEELATIYRFPSAIAATPTLERLESKKAEPPHDLPV